LNDDNADDAETAGSLYALVLGHYAKKGGTRAEVKKEADLVIARSEAIQ
jgi:hypothetical protein